MQFIDKVIVKLKAGNGGNGIVAFAHEKYRPLAGPSGGDGGNGGSIIFKVDTNKNTLLDLRYNKIITAKNGENGKVNKMTGASSQDVIIKIPLGTIVRDNQSGELIADFYDINQEEIICKGGKGGKGNHHFATSRNSAPEYAKLGEKGEEKEVLLELKLLADVGLVGLPSVGKSTLLSVVSNAKPEIADYPFTTLTPQLGMVKVDDTSFVMADLPGLIEGASEGKGLGLEFLRHIERCRLIVHVLDMSGDKGLRDPIEDFRLINKELGNYPGNLLERKQLILANKIDEDNALENLERFKETYPDQEVFPASAIINEGLQGLLYRIKDLLKEIPYMPLFDQEKRNQKVIYTYEKEKDFNIFNEGNGIWRIEGDKIERMFEQTDLSDDEASLAFSRFLSNMKVDEELRNAGCKNGDYVFIKDYGFEFVDE